MTTLGTVTLETLVDLLGLDKGLDQAQDKAEGVFDGLSDLGSKAITIGVAGATAAITALGAGLAFAVGEAMEAQEVTAQLDAVLESTGGAAGVTADMAMGLADSLSMVTRFGDEAILAGENMLLTFTNIGKDVFPMATEAMLDLSQATGQDLQSSAVQLGKALNDPIAGITALTRVGVTFTEEQKKMIESLVAAGDMAGAQTIILDELAKEFGGSAEAAGETFAGQLDILHNALGNVAESIGAALLPVLSSLVGSFTQDVLPVIQTFGNYLAAILTDGDYLNDWLTNLPLPLQGVALAIGTVVAGFQQMLSGDVAGGLETIFGAETAAQIMNFATLFGQIATVVGDFVTNTLIPFVQEHAEEFKAALIAIGAVLAGAAIASAIGGIVAAIAALANPVTLILGVIGLLAAAWEGNWGGMRDTLTDVWTTTLQPALAELWDWLGVQVPLAMETLGAYWEETLQPALEGLWQFVSENIVPILEEFGSWLATHLPEAMATLGQFWEDTLKPALQAAWDFISTNIVPILTEMWNWLATNLPVAVETLAGFWNDTLLPALELTWGFISESVLPLLNDLWTLIETGLSVALEAFAGIWQNVLYPAIEDFWTLISETVKPGLDLLEAFWTNTLVPAFSNVTFLETLSGAFDGLKTAISAVREIIQGVITKLQELGDNLPDWATPGSPMPLEIAMWGLAASMTEVGRVALPTINDGLGKITDQIVNGMLGQVNGDLEGILKMASKVGGLGSKFSGFFEAQTLDPMRSQLSALDEQIAALQEGPMDFYQMTALNALQVQRAELAEEIANQEQRILDLQEKQQQLDFLQAQMDLIEMVQDAGLDASILAGLATGLDADAGNLMDVMSAVMQALIEQANADLQIGSPSKVFADMGENVTETLTDRLWAGATDVAQAMAGITDEMMVADSTIYAPAQVAQQAVYAVNTSGQAGQVVHEYNFYNPVITNRQETEKLIEDAFRKRGERADVIRRTG